MPLNLSRRILFICIAFIFSIPGTRLSAVPSPDEYLVLLPPAFSKQAFVHDLSTYFETDHPVRIDLFTQTSTLDQDQWALVRSEDLTAEKLAGLQEIGRITYYQKNHVYRVHDTVPTDPLYQEQWYHKDLAPYLLWDDLAGKPEIIVGVIDTGIEYTHPDLAGSMWVNVQEDLNKNGVLDSADLNGRDDDGNGFIDDVIGWDFTDAPRFRDSGDYLDPDNDPQDEYFNGHGTQIAGIISAGINNGIGIAGLVPGLRIMNLRAGTANGYLEEDDVARAVLYAVENGARVINMSFGDTEVSRFLADVLMYAHRQGVVLVASSGNSGDNVIHFPAALATTIAVGSSDRTGKRSGFSSWGDLLDLLAPGEDILSCSRNSDYNYVQGTSFSAPIVSAAAGMLLRQDSGLSNADVRHLLKSNARDINLQGWDPYSGAGIVDFERLQIGMDRKNLQIHTPEPGASYAGAELPVIVTARDPSFRKLRVLVGVGEQPEEWEILLREYNYQVIEDTIAYLELTHFPDTLMVVRVLMEDWYGQESESRSPFLIDRTPPVLHDLQIENLLDGDRQAILLEFQTDDLTGADLYYRAAGESGDFDKRSFRFESRDHKLILNSADLPQKAEFYIELRNRSGQVTVDDDHGIFYRWDLGADPLWSPDFDKVPWQFPAGFALPFATDFDADGYQEVVMSRYVDGFSFGPLQIFEFDGAGFVLTAELPERMIPRDTGDADRDGFPEILAGFGQHTFLLEATAEQPFPMQVCWQDTGFWGSRITDLDQDGMPELLGRRGNDFVILETRGNNSFIEQNRLENLSPGANALGPPRTVVADFDQDGKLELVYGDYDGDLVIYENDGDNTFRFSGYIRLAFSDATDFFTAGPVPDGPVKLVAASYSAGTNNYEHEFEARYWVYEIFENKGSDHFERQDLFRINEYHDVRDFDAATSMVNFNGNQLLVCAPYPNLYLFRADNGQFEPFWHATGARTNTVIIEDFDLDGSDELYYSNGSDFTGIEPVLKPRPPMPRHLTATPQDTSRITLDWDPVSGIDYYVVLRADTPADLVPVDSVSNPQYIDQDLVENQMYYYAVQTVGAAYPEKKSLFSQTVSARPNHPPQIDSVTVLNAVQLRLFFNEPMLERSLTAENFRLFPGDLPANSAIPFNNFESVLITFSDRFRDGVSHTLKVAAVRDTDGTFLAEGTQMIDFTFQQPSEKPYVKRWELDGRRKMIIEFNVPMDPSSVLNIQNYRIDPSGFVADVQQSDAEARTYVYTLSADVYAGPTGVDSRLICMHLMSRSGYPFTEGNEINLAVSASSLDNLFPYPQPAGMDDQIIFANVPDDTEIRIFDLQGILVRKLATGRSAFGGLQWDLRNENGQKVAAGIYIYMAKTPNASRMGKLSVVR